MAPISCYLSALVLSAALGDAISAHNGTPPMGWNSYNTYNCFPSEKIMKDNAQGLVDLGFAALGYTIVTTDCGWPAPKRTADGSLTWNPKLFPSGGMALGNFIHSLGLKFGLYSGAGVYQCGSNTGGYRALPASLGHETKDAATFAAWNGDSLKYDNCWPTATSTADDFNKDDIARFTAMADALNKVNRPIEYGICQWGSGEDLGDWAAPIAISWRVAFDVTAIWSAIIRITNQVVPYFRFTSPGHYPDMDMLVVGLQGLSFDEERFHFSMWAINKSPLIIGCGMNKTTPSESLAILANTEIIAINQDPLGEGPQLIRRYTEQGYDIWAGNLSSNKMVVGVFNWANRTMSVKLDLQNTVGVSSATQVRDVWKSADMGPLTGPLSLSLAGHQASILVLSDVNLTTPSSMSRGSTYYPASKSKYTGHASFTHCGNTTHQCLPAKSKVGNLSKGSTVLFNNIILQTNSSTTRVVGVDWINYDVSISGNNFRNLTVSVNGGQSRRWEFPISGGDWFESGRLNIELDGFVGGGITNKILLLAVSGSAPDIVGLEVYE